jgi:spore maturation protein CgeB
MTMNIVVFGLSITSSWGNGHATTYRALIKGLAARGHRVTFAERDVPWYRHHRDLHDPDYCRIALYRDLGEVARRFSHLVSTADLVILGSYVPEGAVLGDWITSHARGITAFYDIDTPVTLAKLETGEIDYLSERLIPRFDLFLSFTGGPTLRLIEERYGSPRARALYCAADLALHTPLRRPARWCMGYLGTYSADRAPALNELLIAPALELPGERFVVAGAQYPPDMAWPDNVERTDHVAPAEHAAFYASQRFTLNITRADMVARGYSPSVRLFEAAACGVPIISDGWAGLETVFEPDKEILVAADGRDVIQILASLGEERRRLLAAAARRRLLKSHSGDHRARELESYWHEARAGQPAEAKEVTA